MAPPDTIILRAGEVVADGWVSLDDAAPPPCGDVVVSAERLTLDEGALGGHMGRIGVCLPSSADLTAIARFLPGLALVVVDFPSFRDGRGFSLARALRERHGFAGEIRARGHILPDQYLFLARCGVDTVVLPAGTDLAPWRAALRQFQVAYQPAADAPAPASPLRRALAAR
jgi:uncharacterized protein (DUF934 family)